MHTRFLQALTLAVAFAAGTRGASAQTFSLNWNPRSGDVWVELHAFELAASLGGSFPACAIHQNAAHGLGRRREEVPPMVPLLLFPRIDEPQVRLVYEGRRAQRISRRFRRHARRR